ncbi:DUF2314 domain-containing protein [Arcanobacterium pinnipediorum]|uniref:DUF2314 domain-containing protein n=1 Tax=Arcanobacterium pinnipediorum TaxID=1503041 RepID=A0ABY5AGB8_9ACTO|nr:DUF2314 domain-containing protein [Arcanobacterium pinnipediorum]USR79234.1 DUF2314 domain-containing protein [Arcanobacterium pinnipediorum]
MTTTEATREWELWDAQELASLIDGFPIPSLEQLQEIQPGDIVKLVFGLTDPETDIAAERMWVIVNELAGTGFIGTLDTDPEVIESLTAGDEIHFDASHVIEIFDEDAPQGSAGGCGGNCNCTCGQ